MKRISVALLLMLLSSTAHARGYSFSIGGHHIYLEAGRHCRSLSCVAWSDSQSRRSHREDDDAVTPTPATPAPAKPVATAPACPPVAAPTTSAPAAPVTAAPPSAPTPVMPSPMPAPPPAPVRAQVAPAPVTPAPAPIVQPAPVQVPVQAPVKPAPVVQAQAPSTIGLAAANAQAAPKPDIVVGKPKEKATVEATVTDKPVDTPDWAKDWSPPPKDAPAPKPAKVVAHEDDSPVGDWQTEGKKGLVRIEKCGAALCGYLLNETTNTTGETVLSNMKAKTDAQWAGDIYSRASGNTYYAKMTFKQPDTLRVEACAIGRFFCSGNDWTRVPQSDEVVTSRNLPASPKS
jgi:uncharacterized protein (DUF2147 family)